MITFFPQFQDRIRVEFLGKTDDCTVPNPRVKLWQVHGNRTIVAHDPMESTEQADGVITNTVGLHLTIRAADCQNFAIYAPERHVAGVLHVGWRGVLLGAVRHFLQEMESKYTIAPSALFVAAGPSLCLQCAEYTDSHHELRKKIDPRYVHTDHVDLQGAATNQFAIAGVPPDRIERHPDCTKCHPERYYTYRGGDKERVESGVSNILMCTLL